MSMSTSGQAIFGGTPDENLAANLVRTKLQSIYQDEPSVIEEEKEIATTGTHSQHQVFMENLMKSNKSLVEIQTSWHAYYQGLNDSEKHEVWQEFYEEHSKGPVKAEVADVSTAKSDTSLPEGKKMAPDHGQSMSDLHKKLLNTVNANGKLKAKHHVKSVAFSLAFASFITGILFFITNNERFITPFIQPTKSVAAAPLILTARKLVLKPR